MNTRKQRLEGSGERVVPMLDCKPSLGRERTEVRMELMDGRGRPEGWTMSKSIFCGDKGGLLGVNE